MSAIQNISEHIAAYPLRIRHAKEAHHLTNAELARLSGVSLSAVNKLLAGSQMEPRLYNAAALCSVLGLSLDELFGLEKPADSAEALHRRIHELELSLLHADDELAHFRSVAETQVQRIAVYRSVLRVLMCICSVLAVALAAYLLIDSSIIDAGLILWGSPTVWAWLFIALLVVSVAALIWSVARSFLSGRKEKKQ